MEIPQEDRKTVCRSFVIWNCELEGLGQNQQQVLHRHLKSALEDTEQSSVWSTECNTRPDLHDEIPGEPDQGQQGVLEGGCQGQALAAEGAQVGGLHGADVAFCRDGVVGKGVALGRDTHTHMRALDGGQSHTLPPFPAPPAAAAPAAPISSSSCSCTHTTSGPE